MKNVILDYKGTQMYILFLFFELPYLGRNWWKTLHGVKGTVTIM